MRDDGYEAAVKTADTHQCRDCRDKSRLAVRMVERRAQAWCRVCGRTDGFVRRKTTTEIFREHPESLPIHTQNVLAKKHHKAIEAVAEGLPPELAAIVRQKYGVEGKEQSNAG